MTKLFAPSGIAMLLSVLSCSGGDNGTPEERALRDELQALGASSLGELRDDCAERSGDERACPWLGDAAEVSLDEFQALLDEGSVEVVSVEALDAADAARLASFRDARDLLQARDIRLPSYAGTEENGDGTRTHTEQRLDEDGNVVWSETVTLEGRETVAIAMAEGLMAFEQEQTQRARLTAIHASLSELQLRNVNAALDVGLPADADDFQTFLDGYEEPFIALHNLVTEALGEDPNLGAQLEAPPQPLTPRPCENELGGFYDYEGDEWEGEREFPSTCGFSDDGIMAVYDFPYKDDLSCVKSQGRRGTCGSFGIASNLEYLANRLFSNGYSSGQNTISISEQALYSEYKMFWEEAEPVHGADGMITSRALKGMADDFQAKGHVIPLESAWAYNPSRDRESDEINDQPYFRTSCTDTAKNPDYSDGLAERAGGSDEALCSDTAHQRELLCVKVLGNTYCGYVRKRETKEPGVAVTASTSVWKADDANISRVHAAIGLALELMAGGNTFVVAMPMNDATFTGTDENGFVLEGADPGEDGGGHIVHMVSFITTEHLKELMPSLPSELEATYGYFILKNSWGACYGDGGYLYLPLLNFAQYATNANRIEGITVRGL